MKTLNFWRTLFLSALAMTAFAACSNDDEPGGETGVPEITVNGKDAVSIAAGLAGADPTEAITVVSTGEWIIEAEGDTPPLWVEPIQKSGKAGTSELTFKIAAVTESSVDREATFVLTTQGMVAGYPIPATAKVTVKQNETGSTEVKTNVAEIREKMLALVGTDSSVTEAKKIAEELTLTGIVASDIANGGFAGNQNCPLVDNTTEAGAGILVRFSSKYEFPMGQVITGSIKGASVAWNYGVLQITIAPTAFSAVAGATVDLEPIVVANIADLPKYMSQYVRVNEVQPTEAARKSGNFADADQENYKTSVFETKTGSTFDISVYKTNNWATSVAIPEKSGYICGLVSIYSGKGQISPRNAEDVAGLTEALFEIEKPEPVASTIAKITGAGEFEVSEATVVATYKQGVVIADATGAMLLFRGAEGEIPAVGTKLKVAGTVTVYGDALQFGADATVETLGEGNVEAPQATAITADNIESLMRPGAGNYIKATFVKMTGTLSVSGNYYNVILPFESAFQGSISYPNDNLDAASFNGKPVIIEGWFVNNGSKNGNGKYCTVVATSIKIDGTAKILTFDGSFDAFSADAATEQTVAYTATNVAAPTFKIEGADAAMFRIVKWDDYYVTVATVGDNATDAAYTAKLVAKADDLTAELDLTQSPKVISTFAPVTADLADWSGEWIVGYPDGTKCYVLNAKFAADSPKTIFTYTFVGAVGFDGENLLYVDYNKITVAKIDDTYYSIKYGDEYVGWVSGDKNNLHFSSEAPTTDSYMWTFSYDETSKLVKILCKQKDGDKDRYFQFNANKDQERFSSYTGMQKNVQLYR